MSAIGQSPGDKPVNASTGTERGFSLIRRKVQPGENPSSTEHIAGLEAIKMKIRGRIEVP